MDPLPTGVVSSLPPSRETVNLTRPPRARIRNVPACLEKRCEVLGGSGLAYETVEPPELGDHTSHPEMISVADPTPGPEIRGRGVGFTRRRGGALRDGVRRGGTAQALIQWALPPQRREPRTCRSGAHSRFRRGHTSARCRAQRPPDHFRYGGQEGRPLPRRLLRVSHGRPSSGSSGARATADPYADPLAGRLPLARSRLRDAAVRQRQVREASARAGTSTPPCKARGAVRGPKTGGPQGGAIPARAGMVPSGCRTSGRSSPSPRTRGDGPGSAGRLSQCVTSQAAARDLWTAIGF